MWTLTVCSHTFILFWLRKISTSIKTYQLSFSLIFLVPFIWRSLHFFGNSFLFLFLFLCYPYFGTFHFYVVYEERPHGLRCPWSTIIYVGNMRWYMNMVCQSGPKTTILLSVQTMVTVRISNQNSNPGLQIFSKTTSPWGWYMNIGYILLGISRQILDTFYSSLHNKLDMTSQWLLSIWKRCAQRHWENGNKFAEYVRSAGVTVLVII